MTVTTPNVSCAYQPPSSVTDVTYVGCTPGNRNGTGSEIVNANVFQIIPGPGDHQLPSRPTPATRARRVVFNITGSATHWQQNFTQFYIAGGGSDLTINDVIINSATSATVDMTISPTANPGARSIYMVTTGESLTDSGAFVVTGGVPVISYLSPNSQRQPWHHRLAGRHRRQRLHAMGHRQQRAQLRPWHHRRISSRWTMQSAHRSGASTLPPMRRIGYRTVVVQTGSQGLTGNFLVTAPALRPRPTSGTSRLAPHSPARL